MVPVLVAVKVGVTPPTAALFASFKVIVTLAVAVPFATTGPPLTEIVECAELTEPAAKTTELLSVAGGVKGEVMLKILVSPTVDFNVQLDTPDALVLEQELITFPLPLAVNEGMVPEIAFPLTSFRVIVTAE